ncbi:MAG TPA: hypothetical protein VK524_04850 [Polyangiaceae bacterium]|nr:hypothetical protein [Polyangiaceae bacterium]
MNEPLTFRDFAAAIMSNDVTKASSVLEVLLGLEPERAQLAAQHFAGRMQSGGPEFMMKAMGMRQVVEARDASQLKDLLVELFGLEGELGDHATTTIAARYA